jgi:thioredoxin reductase
MADNNIFDVIIVGGSYAGLSAAMTLGRSLRNVLIIDSGEPCNKQTPNSHNLLGQDGAKPFDIFKQGKKQVLKYSTVKFISGLAKKGYQRESQFIIELEKGKMFTSKKILFATGLNYTLPEVNGLSECWGISVVHCPYCHGYEIKKKKTGLLGNGDSGFDFSKFISNWTKDLTLFTNGKSTLTNEQTEKLNEHAIKIVEKEISHFDHEKGWLKRIVFKDGTSEKMKAVYARGEIKQHCKIPTDLGCELTEHGYINIDDSCRTTVKGIYAAGDNSTMFKAVSSAIAAGSKAGAMINKELIDESF